MSVASTTRALGIFQADVIIRSAIIEGIADLRRNPYLLDYILAGLAQDELTKKAYGEKEIAQFKKFFLRTEIPVVMNTRRGIPQLPAISIMLQESAEVEQTHGDINYETQETREADWTPLAGPFAPTAYDPATGNMTLPPSLIEELVVVPGMFVIDATGKAFEIVDMVATETNDVVVVLGSKDIVADFRKSFIKGAQPKLVTTLESVSLRETYSIGCHVEGKSIHLTYLHSILIFILLRNKQALLEARGFESTSLQSGPFDFDRATEVETAYARFVSISGRVRHTWPKAVTERVQAVNAGFTIGKVGATGTEAELWLAEQDSLSFSVA